MPSHGPQDRFEPTGRVDVACAQRAHWPLNSVVGHWQDTQGWLTLTETSPFVPLGEFPGGVPPPPQFTAGLMLTGMDVVALLLITNGSGVGELMEAVLVITVPGVTPQSTLTFKVQLVPAPLL